MNNVSLGDMAQAFILRRHNTDMKAQLQRLTAEMGSGQKADLAEAVSGDFKGLAGIDHSLSALNAYKTATSEATLFTGALQSALETVQQLASDLAPTLASAGTSGGTIHVNAAAVDARQKLHSAVSALNVQIGDRYLLSGAATDKKPVADAQDILNALTTAIAGQVTATGVITTITNWFDAPAGGGGYLDTVYGGSTIPLAPFAIGANEAASMTITASDDTLRGTLKGLALAAMVAEGALPGDTLGRALLLETAGHTLFTANTDLAALRGNLGSTEGHISDISARNQAETSALEIARSDIIAADPFTTANELEAVKTRLETLYTLTARLSRLSLADYLR